MKLSEIRSQSLERKWERKKIENNKKPPGTFYREINLHPVRNEKCHWDGNFRERFGGIKKKGIEEVLIKKGFIYYHYYY